MAILTLSPLPLGGLDRRDESQSDLWKMSATAQESLRRMERTIDLTLFNDTLMHEALKYGSAIARTPSPLDMLRVYDSAVKVLAAQPDVRLLLCE